MKRKTELMLATALLVLSAVASGAEEKLGVKIYEGAKVDNATSAAVSESMSIEAFCYRTSDSLDKVVAFYKKEPGLEFMGGDKEGAMFTKGSLQVTIQNPWMDMKTGKITKDTLITIVRN